MTGPAQQYNQNLAFITREQQQYLKGQGQGQQLVVEGYTEEGLDMLSKNGQWGECLDLAEKKGGEILNRYLIRFAKLSMEKGKFGEAIQAFAKYGMTPIKEQYPLYKTLAVEIFIECDQKEITSLRQALFNFYRLLEGTGDIQSPAGKEFGKYTMVAHLLNLKNLYEQKNITALHSKISIAVLRYCEFVRIDKLYYEAGMAAKKQNQLGFAFMLLNRYLDIYEVIQVSAPLPRRASPAFATCLSSLRDAGPHLPLNPVRLSLCAR